MYLTSADFDNGLKGMVSIPIWESKVFQEDHEEALLPLVIREYGISIGIPE